MPKPRVIILSAIISVLFFGKYVETPKISEEGCCCKQLDNLSLSRSLMISSCKRKNYMGHVSSKTLRSDILPKYPNNSNKVNNSKSIQKVGIIGTEFSILHRIQIPKNDGQGNDDHGVRYVYIPKRYRILGELSIQPSLVHESITKKLNLHQESYEVKYYILLDPQPQNPDPRYIIEFGGLKIIRQVDHRTCLKCESSSLSSLMI